MRGTKGDLRKQRTPHPAPRTPQGFTYRQAVERLKRARIESALLDAACLLEAASGVQRWRFMLEPERPVSSGGSGLLESMLSRREAREPIAYILGAKEFWSLPLAIGPGVLIPRLETETLVEAVLEKIRGAKCEVRGERESHPAPRTPHPAPKIVDLGTGCGAIALALASEIPRSRIWAIDRSHDALRIAMWNAEKLGFAGQLQFLAGDLFEPLRTIRAEGRFDLIVANPPYIPSDELVSLPPEVGVYEPHEALDGGPDGLRYHRRIIEAAPGYLDGGGWLALEIGDGQAAEVARLIEKTGAFGPVEVRRDLAGHDRVVLALRRTRANG